MELPLTDAPMIITSYFVLLIAFIVVAKSIDEGINALLSEDLR